MTPEQVIAGLEERLRLVIARSNGELTCEIALYRAAIEHLKTLVDN